jgi:DNA-binding HxlR family transcriptional regulator
VRSGIALDAVEGFLEVVGQGVGGGDDVVTGLDLDGAVAAGGLHEEEPLCSIERALQVVGDRWTLLILREALLQGATRFADFRNDLGIAADILTSRLADLVDEGLMEKRPYREPGARMRYSYHLTPAGEQLRLVLAALQQWGDENRPPVGGPSTLRRSADRGRPVSVRCRYSHPAEQRAVHPGRLGPTLKQPSGLGLAI